MKELKDLGWANGWGEDPAEYAKHKTEGAKHPVKTSTEGSCVTRYTCEVCGITWRVDSSD